MQRSETDLDRVLGHRDPAGGEAGRDQGQLLADGGGVDAEGSGQVGDRDPTAGGPEAGGEADQVDLKGPHRLGRAEQDVGGGVQAEAAAEALEGADRRQPPATLDLRDHGVGDAGAARGLADADPEHLPAAAELGADRARHRRLGPTPRWRGERGAAFATGLHCVHGSASEFKNERSLLMSGDDTRGPPACRSEKLHGCPQIMDAR